MKVKCRICDICGKEAHEFELFYLLRKPFLPRLILKNGEGREFKSDYRYDMCFDCGKRMIDQVLKKKEELHADR